MGVRLLALASGRGSNFTAIADAVNNKRLPQYEIIGLVCNRPGAPVLEKAAKLGIRSFVIDSSQFKRDGRFDRDRYETKLLELIEPLHPDLLCLAGYMLLLGPKCVRAYPGKIINIHPSLLPAFKGLRAQKQAIEAGASRTGCTVHYVTEEMDAGPIIAQRSIEILPHDTEDSLTERLLAVEHETYVEALGKLAKAQ